MFGASRVKIVKRRFKFDFLFPKLSAVHHEAAVVWHLHGPDPNEPRPAPWTAVQCPSRLPALRAVSLADADQTRERPLPAGSKHGSAVVSSRAKVLFRIQGVSVPLRPPELGLWQRHQGDHWAC